MAFENAHRAFAVTSSQGGSTRGEMTRPPLHSGDAVDRHDALDVLVLVFRCSRRFISRLPRPERRSRRRCSRALRNRSCLTLLCSHQISLCSARSRRQSASRATGSGRATRLRTCYHRGRRRQQIPAAPSHARRSSAPTRGLSVFVPSEPASSVSMSEADVVTNRIVDDLSHHVAVRTD